jgi:nucleotide-binding universal stress UspA family protein
MSSTPPASPAIGFERILVPIDFSADSLSALQVANERFARPTATLTLVCAVDAADTVSEHADLRGQVVGTQAADVQRQLQLLANTHRALWQDVQTVVEVGKPASVIMSAAQTCHADLVLMGSHGKTSLTRTLFGGTTYHVARKLACSVLVLRAGKVA